MKAKTCWFVALALSGLAVACSRSPAPTPAAEVAPLATPEFSAKKGLYLPESTMQSLGVKLVEVGEQKVSAAMPLAMRVYRTKTGVVLATGATDPETARGIRPGQQVHVTRGMDHAATGSIVRVDTEMVDATGLTEVLAEIPCPPDSLQVGDFIDASLVHETGNDVVTLPRSALLECSEGTFVYTVSGEHFVRTSVKVGAMNDEWVEITDGLYAGDQVALQPVLSLWMIELAATKGGQACCFAPPKGK